MAAPVYPLVRGKRVDFSDFNLSFQAADGSSKPIPRLRGYTGFDWNISRSGELTYGNHTLPTGQRRGQTGYSASITLMKEEWQLIKKALGPGYGEIPINISGTWRNGSFESSVEIIGATILDEGQSGGNDASPEVTIELLPSEIIEDGIPFIKPE